jgi:hypothetical protein
MSRRYETPKPPLAGRIATWLVVGLICAFALVAAVQGSRAVSDGLRGRNSLSAAEKALRGRKVDEARADLRRARSHFQHMRSNIRSLGPAGRVVRATPLLRGQVKGAEAFADAGVLLSQSGMGLVDAAEAVIKPKDQHIPVAQALESLKNVRAALRSGEASLDVAAARVDSVSRYRLLWPLDSARKDLVRRLPRVREQAASADRGLGAIIQFAGGSGPRRYLVFSQNPDEVRPTGGFIGTYGVLRADTGGVDLERFDGIETWIKPRPNATIPAADSGTALRYIQPPKDQSLANINATPDWPASSRLALELWKRGGEAPVDGVVSITPALLRRILAITGSVTLPEYTETVTAGNVVALLDKHTHVEPDPDRKEFVAVLAEATLRSLLAAPASKWEPLSRAVEASLNARELLVWSRDELVTQALAERSWDGVLPESTGDFFYNAEFAFASKNGRTLRRTYDHVVDVRPDGSAAITTTMTIANPKPLEVKGGTNVGAVDYITIYGPRDATLDVKASDPPTSGEPAIAGHPAAGWFRAAGPLGQTTLKIVWDAPNVVRKLGDGTSIYGLWWMKLPDHSGDVLNLRVNLPRNWSWKGARPPSRIPLETDVIRTWTINRP